MAYYEQEEYSTVNRNGEKISEEEARIKYKNCLRKAADNQKTKAMALGFAQLVVSGLCIAMASQMQDNSLAMMVNGISVSILLIPARELLKKAKIHNLEIERVDNGRVSSALEELERVEKKLNEQYNRSQPVVIQREEYEESQNDEEYETGKSK